MGPPSRCLYETLGISRIATDGEIKKAYRTLALERHPDKNPNNRVNAEEEFKELQHAYNVLSDPHERSWYDGHRDEILRGWDGNTEEKDTSGKRGRTAKASDVEIYAYFTSSAYDGYTGAQGFYSVFGDVFDRLAREDDNAAEINPECDDEKTHPPFGGADADWSTVRDFYNVWEGFSSRQTFAWADKWKVADVSRVYRREMERENRRERVKERKKFNALVRELVAFVKKRDLRVLNRRKEEERLREQEEERREAQRKNEQKERERNLEHIRAIRDQALEEDAEELDNILASIALDERIERHQRKKQECQNNNDSREEDVESNSGDEVIEEKDKDDENSDEGPPQSEEKTISDGDEEIADLNSQLAASSTESDQSQMPEELYCAACRKPMRTVGQMTDHIRSKKHKAAEKRLQKEVLAEEAEFFAASNPIKEADDVGDDGSEKHLTDGDNKADDSNVHGRKRKNKKRNRLKNIQSDTAEHELDEGTDMETGPERGDTAALRDIGAKRDIKRGGDSRLDRNGNEIDKASVEDDVGKTGAGVERVLSKREKRKLREQRKREADNSESTWKCNRCGASFESRTKLMRHVNALGHGLHVDSKQQK